MKEIHLKDIRGRKLEDMAANELRAILWKRGVEIPETARTKKDLIDLVRKNS